MTKLRLKNNRLTTLTVEPKTVDLYTRFQTEKVILELHGTDYCIEGHIQHANETYIIFVPVEKTRHPLLIPWTSIHSIRLTDPLTEKEPE